MAKRKRLSPAMLTGDTPVAAPEVKSSRPPIAEIAHDAVTVGALQELSDKIGSARAEGRWIEALPLDSIIADHLVRDRIAADADDMTALIDSLRANGQQTAIEVVPLDDGKYGLISGWRRLTALRELAQAGGVGTVHAIIRHPEDLAGAYLSMVEENEIRAGLSFYERARIVVRAVGEGVFPNDKKALQSLFASVPRAKRSKIRSFMRIVRDLDAALRFPAAMSERAGLALVKGLEADPKLAAQVTQGLADAQPQDAAAEQAVILRLMATQKSSAPKPQVIELGQGLECRYLAGGGLALAGDALKDRDFRDRLLAALKGLDRV